jgi:hypothetical protein
MLLMLLSMSKRSGDMKLILSNIGSIWRRPIDRVCAVDQPFERCGSKAICVPFPFFCQLGDTTRQKLLNVGTRWFTLIVFENGTGF